MHEREYGRRGGRSDDRLGESELRREREPGSSREARGFGEERPGPERGFDRDDERMESGYGRYGEESRYGDEGRYGQEGRYRDDRGGYGSERGDEGREHGHGRGTPRRGQLYYGRFEGIGAGGRRYSGAFAGYRGVGPRGYRRSDERIREDACECLTEHREVDPRGFDVRVEDGVVTLSGTVEDRRQKRLAEDALDDVPGVRDVDNRLRIRDRDRDSGEPPRAAQESRRATAGPAAPAGIWAFRDPSLRGNDLRGFDVEALDGRIGKVDDHTEPGADMLVVDTGPWIFGRHVLLPAGLVESVDLDSQTLFVDRTKDEIKNAPEYSPEQGASAALRRDVGAYYGSRQTRNEPEREEQRT